MTLAEALRQARARIDAVDARVLLEHVTGLTHAQIVARSEQALSDAEAARYSALVERRAVGEPISYLIDFRPFFKSVFRVTPSVLIPRPETELLVEFGLQVLDGRRAPRVLDLGTGSGCIAISVALERADAQVVAIDVSAGAVGVARENAARLSANVRFLEGAWYVPLAADERFDLILANPPYIAAADPHLGEGDLRFEPRGALTDESADGLASCRAIVAGARSYLAPGGSIAIEHGYDQSDAVQALMREAGLAQVRALRDLAGIARVAVGCQPG